MKQITVFLLALLFILSPLCLCISAAEQADGAGLTFSADTTYPIDRPFESAPHSVTAWIKLNKSFSGRAGVILGNFGGITSCLNFEITTNGAPRLYYVDPDKTAHDFVFAQVDVRTGDWLHIGFVLDNTTNTASVYINGEHKQSLTNAPDCSEQVAVNPFYVGGDYRVGNAQSFKGEIRSVSVYSTPLQEADINYYKTYFEKDAPGLMAHYEFSAGDKISEDLSGNGYTARFCETWVTNKAPVTDYAYSFCVVGDTQVISEKHPTQLHTIYQWIADNTQSKKIAHVIQQALGISAKVKIVEPQSLVRSQGKAVHVIDNRKLY